jgi:osmoprotectant transport system ATP-binding protein
MYRLTDVRKSYGARRALDGISLEIHPGKTTVLIGPSGCGKSTVFGIMTGLLRSESGSVLFDGRPIEGQLMALRHRLGYVIQDGGLFPHLTGRANVALMARYHKWDAQLIQHRIDELLQLTRLPAGVLERFPAEMSGGQRQRVALMRALMLDADVLLLDEPLGALDPMVRAQLQEELVDIFRRLQKTVVLVTHDLAEAARFGDTVVLMNDGRIVQQGTLQDLADRPAEEFVTQFVRAQEGFHAGVGR